MEHFFDLPVIHKGEELSFPAKLVTFGYGFRFYVTIGEAVFIFEKDDEGNYRALQETALPEPDRELIAAVVRALERIQE